MEFSLCNKRVCLIPALFFLTFPAYSSHEGDPAMQTPADNLAFLKDVAPLMASGRVLSLCGVDLQCDCSQLCLPQLLRREPGETEV